MAKGKSAKGKGSVAYAKGGSNKMFGRQGAQPSKPGVISESSPAGGADWAKGGSGKMFPKQHAGPQIGGGTGGKSTSGDGGKWAKGGTTKMFGYTGAVPAKPGMTAK